MMAFLGELVAGVGAVATAVAPVVSAYQGISALFRPAVRQPPTPHAFFGYGIRPFPGYDTGDTGFFQTRPRYWGVPRYRWQTPTVAAAAARQVNPTYTPMKIDWLGGDREWH